MKYNSNEYMLEVIDPINAVDRMFNTIIEDAGFDLDEVHWIGVDINTDRSPDDALIVSHFEYEGERYKAIVPHATPGRPVETKVIKVLDISGPTV